MWPEWSFVFGRRIDYLSPTLFFTDVLVFGILFAFVFSYIRRCTSLYNFYYSIRLQCIKIKPVFLACIAISVVYMCINVLSAMRPEIALMTWSRIGMYALLVWYIKKSQPPIRMVVFFLFGASAWSILLGTIQFFLQSSIGGPFWILGERLFTIDTAGIARSLWCSGSFGCTEVLRAYATFPHPNVFAGFIVSLTPLWIFSHRLFVESIKKVLHRKFFSPSVSLFFLSVFSVTCITLFITTSRSAIFVFVCLILLSILLAIGNRTIKYFLIAVSTLFLICGVFAIIASDWNGQSVSERITLLYASKEMFFQYPLFGVGAGNFIIALSDKIVPRGVFFLQPVHNMYALILSEFGIIGILLGCVGIFGYIFKKKLHVVHMRIAVTRLHFSPFVVSMIILFILGMVDHYPITLQQTRLLLAVYIGMSMTH